MGRASLASQVSAVMLLHCLLYVFIAKLISGLCIDIKAVVNITKGTWTLLTAPVYASEQSGKLFQARWLTVFRLWHKASLLGETSSATAEVELLPQGDAGAAHTVERGPAWGNLSFWGYFPAWRCCLGMAKFRQCGGAAQSKSSGLCRGSGKSSPGGAVWILG